MGYRHQVISDTMVPSMAKLPNWFIDKYDKFIEFDRDFWVSRCEYKRYGILMPFEEDIQKVIKEMNLNKIFLIYFADEASLDNPLEPDIKYVIIDKDNIIELSADSLLEVDPR